MRRSLAVVTGLVLGALALAGCATTVEPGDAPESSDPIASAPAAGELEVEAAWLDGGRQIVLVTQGSSTCVPLAGAVEVQPDGTVAVTLEDVDAAAPCTKDLVPRGTLVGLPEGVEATAELDLVVAYGDLRGETDLDGYAGAAVEEFSPSAGWVDDGLFAILTWGSSTCAPVVESVTATSGTEAAVVFATPAADQVCTMDMAPRVTLVSVEGVDDDAATVTLSGGIVFAAEPVTLPIG